jgi:Barstar (barnase inhibitor)
MTYGLENLTEDQKKIKELFEQYKKERLYLRNFSEGTLIGEMDIKIITLPSDKITDWDTFHSVFQEIFGFPGFYGCNMDAWIDCMGYLDEPDSGMSNVTVAKGGLVIIRVENPSELKKRCPEQYEALVECAAFVNYRCVNAGESPLLALMPIGYF